MRFTRAEDVLNTRSLNISRRGIYLATEQIKPLGTPVRLSIELDEDRQRIDVGGIVVHEIEEEEGRPRGVGIFLTEIPAAWDALCERLETARIAAATL